MSEVVSGGHETSRMCPTLSAAPLARFPCQMLLRLLMADSLAPILDEDLVIEDVAPAVHVQIALAVVGAFPEPGGFRHVVLPQALDEGLVVENVAAAVMVQVARQFSGKPVDCTLNITTRTYGPRLSNSTLRSFRGY